jgi:hypothetical protein
MVVVPRRPQKSFDNDDWPQKVRRQELLVIGFVAIVGWALAAFFATEVIHIHHDLYDTLGSPAREIGGCGLQP